MKIRIKFTKLGAMKFIGHLDLMRYFQKAMRRAGVDIRYSEGFSPHPVMSFAAPLGVGLTSRGEYLDIEVNSTEDSSTMIQRLNETMAEGVEVLSYRLLPDTAKNAMSLVSAADYTIQFRPGYEPEDMTGFLDALESFYAQDSILIWKKTKKSSKEIDIKPMIFKLAVKNNGKQENDRQGSDMPQGTAIFARLSAGSTDNLKPELMMEAFANYLGQEFNQLAFMIQREEVYGAAADQKGLTVLLPLEDFGQTVYINQS